MSRAAALFDLASTVVRKHESAPPGQIGVIPIVVDDLQLALPVLTALSAVNEGRLFNTADPDLQLPVPATTDALRRAAIQAALRGGTITRRHVELVDLPGGKVDAVFQDPPVGVASPGEQEVLAVARAVAHQDTDAHAFVVITYRESLVDFPFRRAIWDLAVKQLQGMRHGTVRTVVVVAEAAIDIALHCQTGRGFQLAVDGGRLLRRKGEEDLRFTTNAIARRAAPFVIFLGAGFCASSGLPLGHRMRDNAIRRLLGIDPADPVKSDALATLFHKLATDNNWLSPAEQRMRQDEYVHRLTLEQVIRVEQTVTPELPTLIEFRDLHDRSIRAPGAAVRDFGALLPHLVGQVIIVEVNFDRMVEAHSKAKLRVFSSDRDFAAASDYLAAYLSGKERDIPLLKVHGSIEDFSTCVVSTEQTERGVGAAKLATLRQLLNATHPVLWVYVGASMRDLDLRPLLLGEEFARGVDERWVSPYLVDSVEEFGREREPRWRDRQEHSIQDRLVTETADTFFAALREALESK